jgi:Ca2+:H+ antiporter
VLRSVTVLTRSRSLLPIAGNACEHWSALTVSVKDKLTLSIGIAVGSSIQIALFVIPFIVTLGWILGHPLTMFFDPFESAALFLSVVTVNYVIADGKSNWLEGAILVVLYLIIAVCVFFYSGEFCFSSSSPNSSLTVSSGTAAVLAC